MAFDFQCKASITDLYARSEQLSQPLLEKAALPAGWLTDGALRDLFHAMQRSPDAARGCLRTYVHGGLSPEYEDRVLSTLIKAGQPVQDWCREVFQNQPFAIILNKAEGWSRKLASATLELLFPLRSKFPQLEFEITLFIGDYGYTPFGFHVDDGDTSVIHLHSGPNPKTMYILELEDFQRVTPPRAHRSFEFDKLIQFATSFTIEPGDVFVLPSTKYHAGYSPAYSVGVAVAVIRPSANRTDLDTIKRMANELLEMPSGISLEDALDLLRSRRSYMLKSAGGLQSPLPLRNVHWTYASVLSSNPLLPLKSIRNGTELLLYAAGTEISMQNFEAIASLIEAFCTLPPKSAEAVIREHSSIEPCAIKRLIDILLRAGCLELVEDEPPHRERV